MAYNSPADELFYGGAAGGGKTGLIIGLALTKHRRSLILRREAVQVVEISDQVRRFGGRHGSWRGSGHGGTMTMEDGRIIEISGCENEWDKEKYQGRPHDGVFFDEAPHFTKSQVQFISAWNRHEDPKQQCRVVLAGNPPTTPEGRWIVEEFAPWLDSEFPGEPARPGELRWYIRIADKLTWVADKTPIMHEGRPITPRSRTFIPSKLSDNPILSAGDYGSRLQALPEPLRSQMLYGDFEAGAEDDPWQVIPTEWVRLAMQRWRPDGHGGLPQTALGVDVSRGGADKTVIAARYGHWLAPLKKYQGEVTDDGPKVATLVTKEHRDSAVVNIDILNVGNSAYDILKAQIWMTVFPINNSTATKLRDKSGRLTFKNLRAASYWALREALDPNGEERIALPPDNELTADLCAPHYKLMAGGIQIEAKPDIIKRIGRSPDCADAVVMAYWRNRKMGTLRTYSGQSKQTKSLRLVVTSREDMPVIADAALLVSLNEPGDTEPSPHSLDKLLDTLVLEFADLDPAELQETWGEIVPQYGKPAADLIMTPSHAKTLWRFLQRERERHNVIVFVDSGDRRAYSVALAVCDSLGLVRGEAIYEVARPDEKPGEAGNRHVYEQTRKGKGT